MKKIFLLTIAFATLFFACDSSKNENATSFNLTAEFIGVEDSTPIYLQLVKNGELEIVDSAFLKDSKVKIGATLEAPEMVYLKIGNTRKMVNLFGENGSITVKVNIDSLDKTEVTGSKSHDDMMAFSKYMEPVDEKLNGLNEEYRAAAANSDTEKINELRDRYEVIREEQITMIKKFVTDNNESFISPFIIRRYLSYEMEYTELDGLLTNLSPAIHSSKDYQALSERVETLKNVEIGMPAVDFALNDTTGNPIAISAFKGKILLIDFWASWCAPCRQENPNVVKLYNDFRDKGFEIIGVSFDDNRSKWIDAIQQDQLTWPHVSDLKGWQSAAGKLYAINSIPATVLLDRDGNIVAKNLRGDALRKKVEEICVNEDQNI
ncbi:MAG: AhpC/TSA family protein [Cyclobacteriaceae bacterium]|nr:AhpC/TSA family protein [Cyclobacteriaceae bacterium]